MKIRMKILMGFLILAVMLAVAGAYSIYELSSIGTWVQKLLDDNYKSIIASKQMIEALEREDSGVLILLSGKWAEGRSTVQDADKNFLNALGMAGGNLTIAGENELIEKIKVLYADYRSTWNQPIAGTRNEGDLNWYFETVHRKFNQTKTAVEELMTLNDTTMYRTASQLKNRARRAIMPGIVAISSAILFTVLFNFFINLYLVNPILHITRAIKKFLQSGTPVQLQVDSRDELRELANAIMNLSQLARLPGRE